MSDGWDFGPGNIDDLDYNPTLSTGSGIDFGWGSAGNLVGNLLGTWASVEAKKSLLNQQIQGQSYLEGQRMAARNAVLSQGVGLNMGTLLLIGGAVALVMLLKD